MHLIRRSVALLLAAALVQLSTGVGGWTCMARDHGGDMGAMVAGMEDSPAGHMLMGEAVVGTTSDQGPGCGQAPAGPCRMPAGATCTLMATCASLVFSAPAILATGGFAAPVGPERAVASPPATRTLRPEPPPPRA